MPRLTVTITMTTPTPTPGAPRPAVRPTRRAVWRAVLARLRAVFTQERPQ
jgi:hypothetical protein